MSARAFKRNTNILWLICGALLLGCTTPPRQQAPEVVRVTPPAALLEIEAEPRVPGNTATQRDVARYLNDVREWGARAWLRIKEINQWAHD